MFGLTQDYKRDLEIILNGVKKNLDIIMINGRPFVYVAAFGNYINISFDTPKKWKEIFGRLAYILFGFMGLNKKIRMYNVKYNNGVENVPGCDYYYTSNLEIEFDHIPKHSWGLDGEEFKSKTNKYIFSVDKSTEVLIPDKNVKKLFLEDDKRD